MFEARLLLWSVVSAVERNPRVFTGFASLASELEKSLRKIPDVFWFPAEQLPRKGGKKEGTQQEGRKQRRRECSKEGRLPGRTYAGKDGRTTARKVSRKSARREWMHKDGMNKMSDGRKHGSIEEKY